MGDCGSFTLDTATLLFRRPVVLLDEPRAIASGSIKPIIPFYSEAQLGEQAEALKIRPPRRVSHR